MEIAAGMFTGSEKLASLWGVGCSLDAQSQVGFVGRPYVKEARLIGEKAGQKPEDLPAAKNIGGWRRSRAELWWQFCRRGSSGSRHIYPQHADSGVIAYFLVGDTPVLAVTDFTSDSVFVIAHGCCEPAWRLADISEEELPVSNGVSFGGRAYAWSQTRHSDALRSMGVVRRNGIRKSGIGAVDIALCICNNARL